MFTNSPVHMLAHVQGVVLTGGLSLMGGLRDRLEKELAEQGPQAAKFKVTMPANPTERRFSVWIGKHMEAQLHDVCSTAYC
jgi:actin-related protein